MAESRKNFDFGGLDFGSLMAYGGQSRDQLYTFLTNNFKGSAAKFGYTGSFPATAPKGLINPGAVAAGRKIVGMGARRIPLFAGGLQALGGDPIGGAGTAGGGFAGAALGFKLGGPVGAIIGGFAGSGAGQSLARGITGIDINDPLTGPDLSIGGIPLTQYARTKKSVERAAELEKLRLKELLPLMEGARQRQFQRDLVSGQMQMAGSLLGNIYPR